MCIEGACSWPTCPGDGEFWCSEHTGCVNRNTDANNCGECFVGVSLLGPHSAEVSG